MAAFIFSMSLEEKVFIYHFSWNFREYFFYSLEENFSWELSENEFLKNENFLEKFYSSSRLKNKLAPVFKTRVKIPLKILVKKNWRKEIMICRFWGLWEDLSQNIFWFQQQNDWLLYSYEKNVGRIFLLNTQKRRIALKLKSESRAIPTHFSIPTWDFKWK